MTLQLLTDVLAPAPGPKQANPILLPAGHTFEHPDSDFYDESAILKTDSHKPDFAPVWVAKSNLRILSK